MDLNEDGYLSKAGGALIDFYMKKNTTIKYKLPILMILQNIINKYILLKGNQVTTKSAFIIIHTVSRESNQVFNHKMRDKFYIFYFVNIVFG